MKKANVDKRYQVSGIFCLELDGMDAMEARTKAHRILSIDGIGHCILEVEEVKRMGERLKKITIPGRPVPKGRPRLGVRGRTAYVYTPPETKEYEKIVGWVAKSLGCRPVEGPVSVALDIYIRRRMDVDNVAKSVLDGLNGIAYEDDDQVVELLVRKHRVKNAAEERVEIEIGEAS